MEKLPIHRLPEDCFGTRCENMQVLIFDRYEADIGDV